MVEQLETLVVKQAITEALHRYCYSVDQCDRELIATVWHPDGMAFYENIYDGPYLGFVDFVFAAHATCESTSHQVTNVLIEVDGGNATSTSYVTAALRSSGQDIVVRGRYLDSWSRRAGEWRIDERRYVNDFAQVSPSEAVL